MDRINKRCETDVNYLHTNWHQISNEKEKLILVQQQHLIQRNVHSQTLSKLQTVCSADAVEFHSHLFQWGLIILFMLAWKQKSGLRCCINDEEALIVVHPPPPPPPPPPLSLIFHSRHWKLRQKLQLGVILVKNNRSSEIVPKVQKETKCRVEFLVRLKQKLPHWLWVLKR